VLLLPVPQAVNSSTINARKGAGSLVISFLLVLHELSKRLLPNVDLVDFDKGRSSKSRDVCSKLLLIGATGTCLHMSLCLPERDGENLAALLINEKQLALETGL